MTQDTSPEAVAKMLEGVTPGPLSVSSYAAAAGRGFYVMAGDRFFAQTWWGKQSEAEANARFIAWAREAVPALAAERDEWKARAEAAEA